MIVANPSFDYESLTVPYAGYRRTDPRIAAQVHRALGPARTVLNVGAGAGSYEPSDRYVVAVEPSPAQRRQRPAQGKVPAVIATAEALPFDNGAFDAVMAMVTIHHWPDIPAGLRELQRVASGPVVILTFDPEAFDTFWLAQCLPELFKAERIRFPTIPQLQKMLGGTSEVEKVSIPFDCVDGFTEAFYGRPEALLDEGVRRAQSCWGFLPEGLEPLLVQRLADALSSGEWDRQWGHLRTQPEATYALRLVTALP
jgi:SAM-dependent methyltransferase